VAAPGNTSHQLKSLLGVAGGAPAPWTKEATVDSLRGGASLRDIQQQQLVEPRPEPVQEAVPLKWVAPVPPNSASLRDIMTREHQTQAQLEQLGGVARPAHSWAAKLGGGGIGLPPWTAPAPSQTKPTAVSAELKPQVLVPQTSAVTRTGNIPREVQTESSMPTEMAEYCAGQLQRFNADLTLMEYVYTLESPVDVRAYLAEYLGSTPQVYTTKNSC
jgi:hypothetical protein